MPKPTEIERPVCPTCRKTMVIVRISPSSPGRLEYTFECPKCQRLEKKVLEVS